MIGTKSQNLNKQTKKKAEKKERKEGKRKQACSKGTPGESNMNH